MVGNSSKDTDLVVGKHDSGFIGMKQIALHTCSGGRGRLKEQRTVRELLRPSLTIGTSPETMVQPLS